MSIKLLRLAQSLDQLFPIGSYTLSNGMETYVQKGIVKDFKSLEEHLSAYLYMLSFNDLAFTSRAAKGENIKRLDMLCSAVKSPYELRQGSLKQCSRFLKLHTELEDYKELKSYLESVKKGECDGHYCIAMGIFIREIGADITESLQLYCYNIMSSMTNHAVKLVPLRQLEGQKALYNILPQIPTAVERAENLPEENLGAGGCGFDLRQIQHETLYSRLYIS